LWRADWLRLRWRAAKVLVRSSVALGPELDPSSQQFRCQAVEAVTEILEMCPSAIHIR
jgi:hypothetical protein